MHSEHTLDIHCIELLRFFAAFWVHCTFPKNAMKNSKTREGGGGGGANGCLKIFKKKHPLWGGKMSLNWCMAWLRLSFTKSSWLQCMSCACIFDYHSMLHFTLSSMQAVFSTVLSSWLDDNGPLLLIYFGSLKQHREPFVPVAGISGS